MGYELKFTYLGKEYTRTFALWSELERTISVPGVNWSLIRCK